METKQTPVADPANPAGGNGNAQVPHNSEPPKPSANADVQAGTPDASLTSIEAMTGRKFASLAEAQAHYKSLSGLVGDNAIAEQRKRAELAGVLATRIAQENGWSLDAAYAYLEQLPQGKTPDGIGKPNDSFDPVRAETDARMRRLERDLFLSKHPEAESVMVRLDEYTKATGKSLEEAFTGLYGGIVAEVRQSVRSDALKDEKNRATVAASVAAPVPPEPDLYAENMKMYQKTADKQYLREAIKHRWNNNDGLKRRVAQGTT